MADNYIDRLTSMGNKYRLGESTFKYVGQVKISHIMKGINFEIEFQTLVYDVIKVFNMEAPDVSILPYLDDKADCIAFVNCRDNRDHLKIIGLFDDRLFRGKRLAAKPNGFTNLIFDPAGQSKYREQRSMVQLFNSVNYPGSRNCLITSYGDQSRARIYTAANRDHDWDPPSRKRTNFTKDLEIYII